MRTEALNNKYVYNTPIQGSRLVVDLADMHQKCTQSYVRRPFGVGLLVATYDQTGPHLYATEPSGNYFEYYAMAIGSRSQTSKTYLEKEFENFDSCSLDDLIKHALKALAASLSGSFVFVYCLDWIVLCVFELNISPLDYNHFLKFILRYCYCC